MSSKSFYSMLEAFSDPLAFSKNIASWKKLLNLKKKLNSGYTYNKEASAQHNSLHPDIQIHRERNSKIISISEHLPDQARPLFRNLSNLYTPISGHNLEFYVTTNTHGTERTFDSEHCVPTRILDCEWWAEYAPFLFYGSYDGAWGWRHFHSLKNKGLDYWNS